ncbi:MAG: ABC transporter permease [Solirubrobacteraceae bacterium]
MRPLLAKDLTILARSRLLVALLIVYPVAIALLIGFAISRTPSRPRVAIVDRTPPGQAITLGGQRIGLAEYTNRLFDQVDVVRLPTRAAASARVSSGDVIAAIVIPPDIVQRISSGIEQAHVEVIYNGDALKQSLVRAQIDAALARANLALSEQIRDVAVRDIDLLLSGGHLEVLGAERDIVGLRRIPGILGAVARRQRLAADRAQLTRVAGFASFAARNLSLSKNVLTTVSAPIAVKSSLLHGRRTPLDAFAVVVAVSISLMFVGVLLAAGGIALEREEHAIGRLIRGPPSLISREGLLAEKTALAAMAAFAVAVVMLYGVSAFVALDLSRSGWWLLALAFGALAIGALGTAIGALAREVRAASLLAFLLSLPLAFLALVPSGSVAGGLYDLITAISFVFPYKAALQALDAAVNGSSPGIGVSIVHLLALTLLFGALARLGLRRAE